jgi:hypothetical protein
MFESVPPARGHGKTVSANATVGTMDAIGEGCDVLVGVVEELAQPWRLPTFFRAPI